MPMSTLSITGDSVSFTAPVFKQVVVFKPIIIKTGGGGGGGDREEVEGLIGLNTIVF